MTSGRRQLVDGIMLSLCVGDKSAIQYGPRPDAVCAYGCVSEWGEDVCLYTDIYEC